MEEITMQRIQISTNFYLDEFIPKEIYERFANHSKWFIDPRLVSLAQFVRDYFDKSVTINNWIFGGSRNYSGFRPPNTTIGAVYSQHRFGRAIDPIIKGISPDEVRATIRKDKDLFFQAGLRCVEENTPSWTHLDIRNEKKIIWVNG